MRKKMPRITWPEFQLWCICRELGVFTVQQLATRLKATEYDKVIVRWPEKAQELVRMGYLKKIGPKRYRCTVKTMPTWCERRQSAENIARYAPEFVDVEMMDEPPPPPVQRRTPQELWKLAQQV